MDFFDNVLFQLDKPKKTEQVYKLPEETGYDSLSLFAGFHISSKSILFALKRVIERIKSPFHQEFYYEGSNYPILPHINKDITPHLTNIGKIKEEIGKTNSRECCPDEQPAECEKESIKDGRANNGRKAETHLCDGLTDEVVSKFMRQCLVRLFGHKIKKFSGWQMFLASFLLGLFAYIGNPYDTFSGRIAHYYRMVVNEFGELVNCGLRSLQKSIAWLMSELNIPKDAGIWESRAKKKHDSWINLSKDIERMIGELVPVMVEPD